MKTGKKSKAVCAQEPLMSLELTTRFTALLYRYDASFAEWFSSTFVEISNDATHRFRSECWNALHCGSHFAEFVKDAIEEELYASECYWPDFQIERSSTPEHYGLCLSPPQDGEETLEECVSSLRHCLYIRHDDAELSYTSGIGTNGTLKISCFENKDSDPVSRWMNGTLGGEMPPIKPIGACTGETRTGICIRRQKEENGDDRFGKRLWKAVASLPDLSTTVLRDCAIFSAYNDVCMEDGLFSRIMNAFPQTTFKTRTAEYEYLLPAIQRLPTEDQELCAKFHHEDVSDSNKDGFMILAGSLYEEFKTEFGSTKANIGTPYDLSEDQAEEIMRGALIATSERKHLEEEATRSFAERSEKIRQIIPFPQSEE